MSEPKPEFRITPRGFTFAEIQLQDGTLTVQCSSHINHDGQPASCLRDSGGIEQPGTSGLWLRKGDGDSIRLDRRQVAMLGKIITQWLATGFVEP